ncbi:HDOD domain-containing protein [Dyella choica]|uniref:HDOD domain-containing protein n=1 Tax=Dyella choica TaxID=1927959 RepID=A0A3S0Q4H6_9GAMM|nr:HDOD domain-containing protein [Dyella choica]RUL75214.1 HDOD domain-containing protein [Dyella choica]
MASTLAVKERETLKPLEAVLRRLSDSSGFPTLSTTISDVNRVVSSDSSAQQITQVILRDVSLTTKLLQLVNSAVYGQFHGRIRTISRAVLILGCEAVRNATMTLMMLEFSKGRPQERSVQDELVGAFFAGVLSKALCAQLGMPNAEEAVICTMCQNLGKLLVTFFLYEESRKVRSLVEQGLLEEQAAEQVLGISYRNLGVGVARHWNFPDRLVEGMQRITADGMSAPTSDAENLRLAANLANDLYVTALRSSQEDKAAALEALRKRYGAAIKLDTKDLVAAVDQALKEVADCSTTVSLPIAGSSALHAVRVWTGGAVDEATSAQTDLAVAADPLMRDVAALDALENANEASAGAQHIISAGIRDVTEALTSDFALNDVLRMVLETMHRGFGFSRTMIYIRDARLNTMRARFGFGAEMERLIPLCEFPLAFAPDVFHVALEKSVDIVIEDANADHIARRIPEWFRQGVNTKSFLLLPIPIKGTAIGMLYADSERGAIKLSPEQLGSLRTLRSQVVLAFKHGAASGRL